MSNDCGGGDGLVLEGSGTQRRAADATADRDDSYQYLLMPVRI